MDERHRTLLGDVERVAGRALVFVGDHTLEDYRADDLLRAAVERQLMIAGEAISVLSKSAPELVQRSRDHRRIVNLRNVLLHGYAKVDDVVIWDIVKREVPALLDDVRALLGAR